jgi:hypothetical protein
MSHPSPTRKTNASSSPIEVGTTACLSTSRISQEQLAAAERARLYHAGKLRAYAQASAPGAGVVARNH